MDYYVINDWAKLFEKADTRRVAKTTWVAHSNSHESLRHRRMVKHPRKVELSCAWTAIVSVSSKLPPDDRGKLITEEGTPLTAQDLADITGFPETIFELAFEVFTSTEFGWMSKHSSNSNPDEPESVRTSPELSGRVRTNTDDSGQDWKDAESSATSRPTGQDITGQDLYISREGEPEPDYSEASKAALQAIGRWSNVQKPVGRGKPLDCGEEMEVVRLVHSLAQDPPIVRGKTLTPRQNLIADAADILRDRGAQFKHISYARMSIINELAGWNENGGQPQTRARASPQTGMATQMARLESVLSKIPAEVAQ